MAAMNRAHDNNPKDITLIISPEWKVSHVAALHAMPASSAKAGMLQPISNHPMYLETIAITQTSRAIVPQKK